MNLVDVLHSYATEEDCISYLESKVWSDDKPVCSHCGCLQKQKRRRADGFYQCADCKYLFKATHGTIFWHTRVPLRKWFIAICLIANAKKGMSSHELARQCKTTPQTAWYMLMRIRKAMNGSDNKLLKGLVEMDETYVGGKPRDPNEKKPTNWMTPKEYEAYKERRKPKAIVLGAVERKGRVKAQTALNASKRALQDFVS